MDADSRLPGRLSDLFAQKLEHIVGLNLALLDNSRLCLQAEADAGSANARTVL